MEQVALICSNPGKKLRKPCHTAARLKAFGLWLISAKIFLQAFIPSQDFTLYLWYLGDSLQRSEFSPGQAVVEGWLLGTDISPSLSSSYSPPLPFRNVFLQNGTVQWGVLPHASCCKIHLDFSLLNQCIPPMALEPPCLQTTETHQFQPAPGPWTLRPLRFQFFPHVEWAGRWDAEGRGRRQLCFVAVTTVQGKGSKLGKDRAAQSRSTLGGWRQLFHSHPIKPGKREKLFVLLYSAVLVCKDI